jgi:hypothetical protein
MERYSDAKASVPALIRFSKEMQTNPMSLVSSVTRFLLVDGAEPPGIPSKNQGGFSEGGLIVASARGSSRDCFYVNR